MVIVISIAYHSLSNDIIETKTTGNETVNEMLWMKICSNGCVRVQDTENVIEKNDRKDPEPYFMLNQTILYRELHRQFVFRPFCMRSVAFPIDVTRKSPIPIDDAASSHERHRTPVCAYKART